MNIYPFFWFVTALFFLLFELGHPGLFYFLSFSCGSFAAFFASLLELTMFDQIIFFFIVSACSVWIMKRWVRRHGNRGHYQSNVYALLGKRGVVVTPIVRGQFAGYIHIEGQVWAYKTIGADIIPAGSLVEVIDVHGAHLVVKQVS